MDSYNYRLHIDGYTRDTLPMARLAEYLADLAILLGERDSVHFIRVDVGSAVLVQTIDSPAQPKVRERVQAIRDGGGPSDARRAYRGIDDRLAKDNATGNLSETETSVLQFPGRNRVQPQLFGPCNQTGELTGVVVSLGGRRDPVPVTLLDGEQTFVCRAPRDMARRLAQHLFVDTVRVSGTGRWVRNSDGEWNLKVFRIQDFRALDSAPLTEGLDRLRKAHEQSDWALFDDPIAAMTDIQTGAPQ